MFPFSHPVTAEGSDSPPPYFRASQHDADIACNPRCAAGHGDEFEMQKDMGSFGGSRTTEEYLAAFDRADRDLERFEMEADGFAHFPLDDDRRTGYGILPYRAPLSMGRREEGGDLGCKVLASGLRDLVKPGDKILDVGCGMGSLALCVARLLPDVTVVGISVSEPELAVARAAAESEGLSHRVSFYAGDLNALPIDGRKGTREEKGRAADDESAGASSQDGGRRVSFHEGEFTVILNRESLAYARSLLDLTALSGHGSPRKGANSASTTTTTTSAATASATTGHDRGGASGRGASGRGRGYLVDAGRLLRPGGQLRMIAGLLRRDRLTHSEGLFLSEVYAMDEAPCCLRTVASVVQAAEATGLFSGRSEQQPPRDLAPYLRVTFERVLLENGNETGGDSYPVAFSRAVLSGLMSFYYIELERSADEAGGGGGGGGGGDGRDAAAAAAACADARETAGSSDDEVANVAACEALTASAATTAAAPSPWAEEDAAETIFDRIAKGAAAADIVYEDSLCVAFRDIAPTAPVHILVVPRQRDGLTRLHRARADQKELLGHLMLTASRVAKEQGLAETGYRVVVNDGDDGRQSVYHLHLHIIGGRRLDWPPG